MSSLHTGSIVPNLFTSESHLNLSLSLSQNCLCNKQVTTATSVNQESNSVTANLAFDCLFPLAPAFQSCFLFIYARGRNLNYGILKLKFRDPSLIEFFVTIVDLMLLDLQRPWAYHTSSIGDDCRPVQIQ